MPVTYTCSKCGRVVKNKSHLKDIYSWSSPNLLSDSLYKDLCYFCLKDLKKVLKTHFFGGSIGSQKSIESEMRDDLISRLSSSIAIVDPAFLHYDGGIEMYKELQSSINVARRWRDKCGQ